MRKELSVGLSMLWPPCSSSWSGSGSARADVHGPARRHRRCGGRARARPLRAGPRRWLRRRLRDLVDRLLPACGPHARHRDRSRDHVRPRSPCRARRDAGNHDAPAVLVGAPGCRCVRGCLRSGVQRRPAAGARQLHRYREHAAAHRGRRLPGRLLVRPRAAGPHKHVEYDEHVEHVEHVDTESSRTTESTHTRKGDNTVAFDSMMGNKR